MLNDNIPQITTFQAKRQNDCYLLADRTSAEGRSVRIPLQQLNYESFIKAMYKTIKMNGPTDYTRISSVHSSCRVWEER